MDESGAATVAYEQVGTDGNGSRHDGGWKEKERREGQGGEIGGAGMQRAVHDLCQPLMALECLLYVNREPVVGEPLEATSLRGVMEAGLVECGRMIVLVRAMQQRLHAGKEEP